MRPPQPNEYIVCPDSSTNAKKSPAKCFDTIDPNGKKVTYGIIASHHHGFYAPECQWTDLPVKVVAIERYVI